jgi:polyferredoxin/formate hydrogenlyase subunit 6/NADH:ubiquinone oxidoreductase subunit I
MARVTALALTARSAFRLSLRRVRRIVQVFCLAAFVYLAFAALVPLPAFPVDLFFRIDPLAQLSASIGARAISPYALWALPVLALSILLGRAFCGWVCPLGTTLDAFRFDDRRHRRERARLRPLNELLLLAVLVGSALGFLALAILDPITLLMRASSTAILPGLNLAITGLLRALYDTGLAPDLAAEADALVHPAILPTQQQTYRLGALLFGLLASVVALDLVTPRFWCRYLCPLGALLGLLGRFTPLRKVVGPGCSRCAQCLAQCKMAAISPKTLLADPSECVQCFDCRDVCPERAIGLSLGVPSPKYSPSRRRFLVGTSVGVVAVLATRVDATAVGQDGYLIRPPGAVADFLARCVRCSQCIKVCPTSGLQPAGFESGLEGLFSPLLVPRLGYCDWNCTSCGQVCPTGAIQPLELTAKRQTVIGQAYVDQNRCIPWADQKDCIVCQEMCPATPKAVVLDEARVPDGQGGTRLLKRPRVERERCVGCGICESRCPVPRQAAIRVYSKDDPRLLERRA